MGKYFVPLTMLTPADRLRESLGKTEQGVVGLRGTGPQVLGLLHMLDRTANLLAELESDGVDLRAEITRFDTVQRQLRRQQRRFLIEAGAVLIEERSAVQPDPGRWWWFLDEALAQQQRDQLRRTLTWGLIAVFVCAVAWLVYNQFFAPSPESQQAYRYSSAGEGLVEGGDLRAALAEFEAAAALTPDDSALWLWQGVIHHELGESDEAQEAFATARALCETESGFLLDRAMTYLNTGNLQAASADVEQILAADPSSAIAYYVRSSIAVEQDDYEGAIADLERAAELAQAEGDSQLEATARVQRAMVMQMFMGRVFTPVPDGD